MSWCWLRDMGSFGKCQQEQTEDNPLPIQPGLHEHYTWPEPAPQHEALEVKPSVPLHAGLASGTQPSASLPWQETENATHFAAKMAGRPNCDLNCSSLLSYSLPALGQVQGTKLLPQGEDKQHGRHFPFFPLPTGEAWRCHHHSYRPVSPHRHRGKGQRMVPDHFTVLFTSVLGGNRHMCVCKLALHSAGSP